MVLSRPEIYVKESISEFELASFLRALFNSDSDLRHCVGKSTLMSILESSLPDQRPDQEEEWYQHAEKSVVIINGMADVQSIGKPTWVHNARDLASHFLETIDSSPRNVTRSMSVLIVMTFQILSSREFASFIKVATDPWCTQSPMVQLSKRSLSNSC